MGATAAKPARSSAGALPASACCCGAWFWQAALSSTTASAAKASAAKFNFSFQNFIWSLLFATRCMLVPHPCEASPRRGRKNLAHGASHGDTTAPLPLIPPPPHGGGGKGKGEASATHGSRRGLKSFGPPGLEC